MDGRNSRFMDMLVALSGWGSVQEGQKIDTVCEVDITQIEEWLSDR